MWIITPELEAFGSRGRQAKCDVCAALIQAIDRASAGTYELGEDAEARGMA